jgi:hypothetical protein
LTAIEARVEVLNAGDLISDDRTVTAWQTHDTEPEPLIPADGGLDFGNQIWPQVGHEAVPGCPTLVTCV